MTHPLRVVFAGTPEFAVPYLQACRSDGIDLVAAYTQPDRRAGRGRKLAHSPVKQAAIDAGISVMQPPSLKDADAQTALAALAPDLLVVVAYGLILPQSVLDIPRHGCWNVHASLLPRWRGAAPIQRAIAAGDTQTGVCLMQMEAGLDTGPVLLRKAIPIRPDDTGGSLHDRLSMVGADLLGEGLRQLHTGTLPEAASQAREGATYAHKLSKAEAALDFKHPVDELERMIRAFNPWPGASLPLAGERVRIWQAETLATEPSSAPPGTIMQAGKSGIDIACSPGILRIHALQKAGGKRISAADHVNAHPELRQRS